MSTAALKDILALVKETDIKAERKGTANWFTTGYRISKEVFLREVKKQVAEASEGKFVPDGVEDLCEKYWPKIKNHMQTSLAKDAAKKDSGIEIIPEGSDGFLVVFSGKRDNYSALEYKITSVKKGSLRFEVFNPFMQELIALLKESGAGRLMTLGDAKKKQPPKEITEFGANFNLGHTAATTNADIVLADRFNKGIKGYGERMDLSDVKGNNTLDTLNKKLLIKNRTLADIRSDINMVLSTSSFALKKDPKQNRIIRGISRLTQNPQQEVSKMIIVEMESVRGNLAGGKEDESAVKDKMVKTLQSALDNKTGLEWANQEASDSAIRAATKLLMQTARDSGFKNIDPDLLKPVTKGRTKAETKYEIKSAAKKIRPRSLTPQLSLEKRDLSQGAIFTGPSYLSLVNLLNERLPPQVRANMGSPRLNNRTGNFSESAQVTDIITTPGGFPSIGYTYQRSPYDVFDRTLGKAPWNTPERDPSALVAMSVRDLAREMGLTRFYVRRAR